MKKWGPCDLAISMRLTNPLGTILSPCQAYSSSSLFS
jgi:hypothetical protein